jgi:hypothetical protein
MQSQIIFVVATFVYFTTMVYIINPSITPLDSITGRVLLSLGLSAGYAMLSQKMNAGGLSYLALAVLYGTILVVFLFVYSLFLTNCKDCTLLTSNPKSLLTGTYESLILTATDLSAETTLYSNYKNTASPTYAINLNIKLTDATKNQGQIFARKAANGQDLVKVDVLTGGRLRIIMRDKYLSSDIETIINADKAQLSSTQYVPFTFIIQPETLIVYRNSVVIKSVQFKTPIKQPVKEDNMFVIGALNGCSLDVFRFSDTNIL